MHIQYNVFFDLIHLTVGLTLVIYLIYSLIKKQNKDAILSVILLFLIILTTFFVGINRVSGESMMPNFNNKEYIITDKFNKAKIERYDVVTFKPTKMKESLIKRVYGLPGEKVEIKNGDVYINGSKLNDRTKILKSSDNYGPIIIPEDCYFVLGDNRDNSMDSRYGRVGLVGTNNIVSKVVYEFK